MVETPQLWLLSSNRLQSSRQPYRKQGVDHPTGSRLDICKLGICLRTIGVCDQHQRYQAARGSGLPDSLHYENGLAVANGNYVLLHGRFTGIGLPANWIVADIVRLENGQLAEHWDVVEDEATKEASVSGLPMFGTTFPSG
jgi:hypothetical protein